MTQCPCDDVPQRVLRIPAGLSALPRQVQAFPEVRSVHHLGGDERGTFTRELELLRIGTTATKDPVASAELDRHIARGRVRFLGAAGACLALSSGGRIPAVLRRAGAAAFRYTGLADAGAVGSAGRKATIAIETTSRVRRTLAIFAVALARVATLTAVFRVGRCVVARACTATRRAAGTSTAHSTVAPAGSVGSGSRARSSCVSTVGTARRVGSGVATTGSAVFGSGGSPADGSAVRSAFYAQATPTLETGVASAVSTCAAFRPSAALRIASSRLGATCRQEQRRREGEQPPKTPKHTVPFRLQASHARPAGARHGAVAREVEARR